MRSGSGGSTAWARLICFERRGLWYLFIRWRLIAIITLISSCTRVKVFIGGGVGWRHIVVPVAVIDKDIMPL